MKPALIRVPKTTSAMLKVAKAQRWEKAAWAWAFTIGTNQYTPKEFAKLGIPNMRSAKTVAVYAQEWQDAIEAGYAKPVRPGRATEMPSSLNGNPLPWTLIPDAEDPRRVGGEEKAELYAIAADHFGTTKGQAIRAGASKAAMMAAILADDLNADAARVALLQRELLEHKDRVITDRPFGKFSKERDEFNAHDEFTTLLSKLESMKEIGDEAVSLTVDLRGVDETQKRDTVIKYIEEIRAVLNTIENLAKGKSIDKELQALLNEGM
jgi:hypothetical protein